MIKKRNWVLALCALVFAGSVQSQVMDGIEAPDKKWHHDFTYYVNEDCGKDSTYEIIHQVAGELGQWSVNAVYRGRSTSFAHDGRNSIGCANESPFLAGLMTAQFDLDYEDYDIQGQREDGSSFVYGTARTWYVISTGKIVEFDIWINTLWSLLDRLAIKTVRHEFGHALGVSHSEFEESLMWAYAEVSYWDVETIAKLSLSYGKCQPMFDEAFNLWMPSALYGGKYFYGIMPHGGVMPYDFVAIGLSTC